MKTVEGYDVDGGVLALVGADEVPVFAARPSYATAHPGAPWDSTTLLLTDRRLVITKDRFLGKAKADFDIEWNQVVSIEGSLWMGGGPKIQLLVHNHQTHEPIEFVVQPEHAVAVESAIRERS